jgi:hypothetical protein
VFYLGGKVHHYFAIPHTNEKTESKMLKLPNAGNVQLNIPVGKSG